MPPDRPVAPDTMDASTDSSLLQDFVLHGDQDAFGAEEGCGVLCAHRVVAAGESTGGPPALVHRKPAAPSAQIELALAHTHGRQARTPLRTGAWAGNRKVIRSGAGTPAHAP